MTRIALFTILHDFFLPFFENLTVIILFGKALASTLFVQGFVFLFVDRSAHFLFSFIPLDFFSFQLAPHL